MPRKLQPFRVLRSVSTAIIGLCVFAATSASTQSDFWGPSTGPGSGPVIDLVREPDGDLYAALSQTPVYRSANGGAPWAPLAVSAYWLAALSNGDVYAFTTDSLLIRTHDDGNTWEHLNTAPRQARALAALPSGTLLLGTRSGMVRSTTNGASWTGTSLTTGPTSVIVVEGNVAYAGNESNLVRSEDDGLTWTPVVAIPNVYITALAPRVGGGWWIGTGRASFFGGSGLLYRYVNGQALVVTSLYADNISDILVRYPNTVFVASLGDPYNESGGSVATSSDDGATWTNQIWGSYTSLVLESADGVYAGSAESSGHLGLYPANGVERTSGSPTVWESRNNGIMHATSFVLAATPGVVYAQAGTYITRSTDHGISWTVTGHFPEDPYGMQLAAHPSGALFTASVPYVLASKGSGGHSPQAYLIYRSQDGGKTWTTLQAPGNLWATVRVTAEGSLLTTAYPGVARSTTGGFLWSGSTGIPVETFDIAPGPGPRVFATAYASTYLSDDDGVSFRQIATVGGGPVATSPLGNLVYTQASTGHVVQLEEPPGGSGDWIAHDLPALVNRLESMAVDELGTVYAASLDSVWHKSLSDTQWHAIPGTPNLRGPGMAGQLTILIDDAGFLYVGTGMHCVLRSRLPVGRPDLTDIGAALQFAWQPGRTPFVQSTIFTLQLGHPEEVSLALFDVRGRLVSTLWDDTQLGPGSHVVRWQPEARLARGTYFYRLTAGAATRTGRVTLVR